MAYISTEVDIDPDDFLEECSENEIKSVIEWLKENDYLKMLKNVDSDSLMNVTFDDLKWNNEIGKLIGNRWRLTREQEEQIIKITETL